MKKLTGNEIIKMYLDFFKEIDADIFCIQETKAQEEQLDLVKVTAPALSTQRYMWNNTCIRAGEHIMVGGGVNKAGKNNLFDYLQQYYF